MAEKNTIKEEDVPIMWLPVIAIFTGDFAAAA